MSLSLLPHEQITLHEIEVLLEEHLPIIGTTSNWGVKIENGHIQELHIFQKPISQLPTSIGNLTHLKSLILINSNLKTLPANLGNLSVLETLTISGGTLDRVPPEIGNLIQLRMLNLSRNLLRTLPDSMENLQQLTQVNFSSNKLKELPQVFNNWTKIHALDLSFNELNRLPSSFFKMQTLISLNLNHNQFQDLPDKFNELKNLKNLNLSSNPIEKLPRSLANLKKLTYLDIRGFLEDHLPDTLTQWLIDLDSICIIRGWHPMNIQRANSLKFYKHYTKARKEAQTGTITSEFDLRNLLIQSSKEEPHGIDLTIPSGETLTLYIGSLYSYVGFSKHESNPLLIAVGEDPKPPIQVVFDLDGNDSIVKSPELVPNLQAIECALIFFRTGRLPENLQWWV